VSGRFTKACAVGDQAACIEHGYRKDRWQTMGSSNICDLLSMGLVDRLL
jgi:hypothetical protein